MQREKKMEQERGRLMREAKRAGEGILPDISASGEAMTDSVRGCVVCAGRRVGTELLRTHTHATTLVLCAHPFFLEFETTVINHSYVCTSELCCLHNTSQL
ncbi:unnamed protein product [Gadus morhua 'NCC']